MIYVVKSQSFLRTPLVSILMEGEDWLVGFDETFDDMSNDSLIEFEGFNNYPAARICAYDSSHSFFTRDDVLTIYYESRVRLNAT